MNKCEKCGSEVKGFCGNCFHWNRAEPIDRGPCTCLLTNKATLPGYTCSEWEELRYCEE